MTVYILGFSFPASFLLVTFLLCIPAFSVSFMGSPSTRYLSSFQYHLLLTGIFWVLMQPCLAERSREMECGVKTAIWDRVINCKAGGPADQQFKTLSDTEWVVDLRAFPWSLMPPRGSCCSPRLLSALIRSDILALVHVVLRSCDLFIWMTKSVFLILCSAFVHNLCSQLPRTIGISWVLRAIKVSSVILMRWLLEST